MVQRLIPVKLHLFLIGVIIDSQFLTIRKRRKRCVMNIFDVQTHRSIWKYGVAFCDVVINSDVKICYPSAQSL